MAPCGESFFYHGRLRIPDTLYVVIPGETEGVTVSAAIFPSELSSAAVKVLVQIVGGPIGAELYDAISKRNTSVDERIAKIELARTNLLEALTAIDEIKTTAEEHQRELLSLQTSVTKIGQERDQLSADRELLVQMTAADKERLRRMLGVPTRLQSTITWVGTFIFGAVTTWLFTLAYDVGIKEALGAGWKYLTGS